MSWAAALGRYSPPPAREKDGSGPHNLFHALIFSFSQPPAVQGQYQANLFAAETSISALEKVLSAVLEGQAAREAAAGSLRREVASLGEKISRAEAERGAERALKEEAVERERSCREEIMRLEGRMEEERRGRDEEGERERESLQAALGVARGEGDASAINPKPCNLSGRDAVEETVSRETPQ